MNTYYYFVATLPSLAPGDEPPQASAAFRELCADALKPGDAALLPYCALNAGLDESAVMSAGLPVTPSAFINGWVAWEWALRLSLADARQAKVGWGLPPDLVRDAPGTDDVAKAALGMENPFEAEVFLDKARWDAINALLGTAYFTVNTVYAHLLKLQLLERHRLFKAEVGFSQYKALYASITGELAV